MTASAHFSAHKGKSKSAKAFCGTTKVEYSPDGNFPILLAITLGLLRRKPADYERLFSILEGHLTKREDPAVWEALIRYLRYLAPADRTRSLQIVDALLQAFPQIFSGVEGVRFVASSHEWFPSDLFENILKVLDASGWEAADRCIGELLLLRVALVPEDQRARKRFEHAVVALESERGEVEMGVVRSAAETWVQPRLREVSHPVLLSCVPNATGDFAQAIMSAFSDRDGKRLPSDQYTSELLAKVAESPNLLRTSATPYLVERLKELLEDNYSPTEVAKLALALVEANAESIRNMSGTLYSRTEDLMNIAITLQRFPERRAYGTSIFEHLLLSNAYKAAETAKKVDRRF